ncbi:MAG: hypothetical protein ABGW78_06975 [Pirellulales bacterium]
MIDLSIYSFDISLHGFSSEYERESRFQDPWGTWTVLQIPQLSLSRPLNVTFDNAVERLSQLDRMFVELDGSFLWSNKHHSHSWQIDGNIFEQNNKVLFVELKGTCFPSTFDALLTCFGWPTETLVFQLTRPSVFLREHDFRRHALSRGAVELGQNIRL